MNEQQTHLIQELIELFQAHNIRIVGYDQYDADETYTRTTYYLSKDGVTISIDDLADIT